MPRRIATAVLILAALLVLLPRLARAVFDEEEDEVLPRRISCVIAESGEPLVGTDVVIRWSPNARGRLFADARRRMPWLGAFLDLLLGDGGARVASVTTTRTDAAGIAEYVGFAVVDVTAEAGDVPRAGALEFPPHDGSVPRVGLVRAGRIAGRIEDESGAPVAGAAIEADGGGESCPGWMPNWRRDAAIVAYSDSRGEFTLPPLPEGARVAVIARRAGLVPARSAWTIVTAHREPKRLRAPLVLRTDVRLDVRVVTQSGAPAPLVRVMHGDPADDYYHFAETCGETFTDLWGHASISRGLDPKRLIVVKAPAGPWQRVGPLDESDFSVTIVLDEPAAIRGHVKNARGEAVAGVSVWASLAGEESRSFFDLRRANSGSDGAFCLMELAPGRYFVTAYREGKSVCKPVTVPDESDDVELLMPSGEIHGVAVDARTGEPLVLKPRNEFDFSGEPWLVADRGSDYPAHGGFDDEAHGRFVVKDLEPGEHRVSAWVRGFRISTSEFVSVGAGEIVEGVRLAMEPVPMLRGVVVDAATGEPIADADVSASMGADRDPESTCGLVSLETFIFHTSGKSSADGAFELPLNAPGLAEVAVGKEGYAAETIALLVGDGMDPATVRVSLATSCVLTGRVLKDGQLVPGCSVGSVKSDAEGRYRLPIVASGPMLIGFQVDPARPQFVELDVPPGGLEHDLVVAPESAGIAGRAIFDDGPIDGAPVELLHLVGPGLARVRWCMRQYRKSRTDERGEFTIGGLSPGEYEVTVRDPFTWGRVLRSIARVGEDGLTRCDLVEADGRLEVVAVDEAGEPLAEPVSIALEALDETLPRGRQCEEWIGGSGDGGRAVVHALPGRYRVRVTARSGLAGLVDADVPRPEGEPLAVPMHGPARVTIGLRAPQRPTMRARAVFLPRGGSAPIEIREQGSLPAGTYDVLVASFGFAPVRIEGVTLAAGETREIVADATSGAGRLLLETDGVPPPGTRVVIRDASGADLAWLAGEYPRFTLAPGRHSVEMTLPDGRSTRSECEVVSGETVRLRLDVR